MALCRRLAPLLDAEVAAAAAAASTSVTSMAPPLLDDATVPAVRTTTHTHTLARSRAAPSWLLSKHLTRSLVVGELSAAEKGTCHFAALGRGNALFGRCICCATKGVGRRFCYGFWVKTYAA
jgi:hypothetical protein